MAYRIRQRGFSLLEVLVALVVLSVGIMGVAGLQFAAMRANDESLSRSQATLLIEGMIERIRANATTAGLAAYAAHATVAPSSPRQECAPSGDGAAAVAAYDVCEWQREMALNAGGGGFRHAQGCISIDGAAITVALAWQGSGSDTAQGECGRDEIAVARKEVVLSTTVYPLDRTSS